MVKIKDATENDILRILEIEQTANSPPWTQGALLSELYKEDSYFIVTVKDTAILGFAILSRTGEEGELLKIAVDLPARRKGVGNLLITHVLDYAAINEYESIFLEVRISNKAAICLYEKHGFKSIRTRKNYYENPVEDALIMAKPLKNI